MSTTSERRQTNGGELELRRFHPERVVNWGFQFSLATSDTPEGQSASEVIRDIDAEVAGFSGAARQFVNTLRMYATSLGHGLRTREERRCERTVAAKLKLERSIKELGSDEVIGGFMSGGWRLLVLGGIVFVLTSLVMKYVSFHADGGNGGHALDPFKTPLATALGTTFLGSYFRSWSIKRKLRKIWRAYEDEMNAARTEYVSSAREEYHHCAVNASEEWRAFFAEDPPSSKAQEALIFGMAQKHLNAELAGGPCLVTKSLWEKIPFIGKRFAKQPTPPGDCAVRAL